MQAGAGRRVQAVIPLLLVWLRAAGLVGVVHPQHVQHAVHHQVSVVGGHALALFPRLPRDHRGAQREVACQPRPLLTRHVRPSRVTVMVQPPCAPA